MNLLLKTQTVFIRVSSSMTAQISLEGLSLAITVLGAVVQQVPPEFISNIRMQLTGKGHGGGGSGASTLLQVDILKIKENANKYFINKQFIGLKATK